ncbi:CPK16 [Symbiodinium natans]|uniref:CPK16 protein n=1 Tax=Symbiodinium natans TaxID=878477 RepID=A0A812UPS7_9DINO|nr:CPK16 [Symbiodinium natans]
MSTYHVVEFPRLYVGVASRMLQKQLFPDPEETRTFLVEDDSRLPWQMVGEADIRWSWCFKPRDEMGKDLAMCLQQFDNDREEFEAKVVQWLQGGGVPVSSMPVRSSMALGSFRDSLSLDGLMSMSMGMGSIEVAPPQLMHLEERLERLGTEVFNMKRAQDVDHVRKVDKEDLQLVVARLGALEKFNIPDLKIRIEALEGDTKFSAQNLVELREKVFKVEAVAAPRSELAKVQNGFEELRSDHQAMKVELKEASASMYNANRKFIHELQEVKSWTQNSITVLHKQKVDSPDLAAITDKVLKLEQSIKDNRRILGDGGGQEINAVVRRIILNLEDKIMVLEKKIDALADGRPPKDIMPRNESPAHKHAVSHSSEVQEARESQPSGQETLQSLHRPHEAALQSVSEELTAMTDAPGMQLLAEFSVSRPDCASTGTAYRGCGQTEAGHLRQQGQLSQAMRAVHVKAAAYLSPLVDGCRLLFRARICTHAWVKVFDTGRTGEKMSQAQHMRSSFVQRLEAMSLSSSPCLDACHRRSLRDIVDTDSDAREASEGDTTQHMSRFSTVRRAPLLATAAVEPRRELARHRSTSGAFGDPEPCLPPSRRPEPLEISEGPIRMGHKVQGSPSELSTAPTAHEDAAAHDPVDPGAMAGCQISSPVGSVALVSAEFDADSAGRILAESRWSSLRDESCPVRKHSLPAPVPARTAEQDNADETVAGLQERLNVLLELAGTSRSSARIPQASVEELETDLVQVTGRARRLWKAVESGEVMVRDLEARLEKSASSSSAAPVVQTSGPEEASLRIAHASHRQPEARTWQEEQELAERIVHLDHGLREADAKAADERRKSTRLRARIARMRQEYQNCISEVAGSRNAIERYRAEGVRWRGILQSQQDQERERRQADSKLKSRLSGLAVQPVPVGEEDSTLKIAKHVGQCLAEAWRAGAARRAEKEKLQGHRSKLESLLFTAKADMELETQRLVRAEEELQRLVADQRARERVVKEEYAVARATNSLLSEERSVWLQTRPKLLNLLESGRQVPGGGASKPMQEGRSASPREGMGPAQALRAAERENKELQATIAALEKDKVFSPGPPLPEKVHNVSLNCPASENFVESGLGQEGAGTMGESLPCRGQQNLELASRLHVYVQSSSIEGMDDEGTALSLNRVQVMIAAAARQLVAGNKWITKEVFDGRLDQIRSEYLKELRQIQARLEDQSSSKALGVTPVVTVSSKLPKMMLQHMPNEATAAIHAEAPDRLGTAPASGTRPIPAVALPLSARGGALRPSTVDSRPRKGRDR